MEQKGIKSFVATRKYRSSKQHVLLVSRQDRMEIPFKSVSFTHYICITLTRVVIYTLNRITMANINKKKSE